jgi:CBS-domain-containing membrane protein
MSILGLQLLDFGATGLPMPHLQHSGRAALWSGLGSGLTILLIQALAHSVNAPLLIAPFGASCVVLFLSPASDMARPRSLLGGYLIGTLVGLLLLALLPGAWWSAAPAVGLTIALMRLTHTVHPPAAAQPLVILLAKPGWLFLLMPTLPGVALLLLTAWLYHQGLLQLTRSDKTVAD